MCNVRSAARAATPIAARIVEPESEEMGRPPHNLFGGVFSSLMFFVYWGAKKRPYNTCIYIS